MTIRDALTRLTRSDQSLLEELDELTASNRAEHDAELERRLIRQRNAAFRQVPKRRPRPTPPESMGFIPDPQPQWRMMDGLPEVDATELDARTIRAAFLAHGSLLVRGLVPAERAASLIEGIDRTIAARDAHLEGAPQSETLPWFEPFDPAPEYSTDEADWNRLKPGSGSVWAADSPRMMFELLEAFEEAGVIETARDYLGERFAFSMNKSVLRRSPPGTGSAWHQDGAFLGEGLRTLNVWLALNRCGEDAPGMEVVPKRLNETVATGTPGATFVWSVSDLLVDELLDGQPTSRPTFEPGDALLFDHLNLHRTGTSPEMTRTRYATETWCFASSAFPKTLVPLVV